MIILWLVLALFGLYCSFVGILRMVAARNSKARKAAIVELITATMMIVIAISAYYLSSNAILSDMTVWFASGVFLGLNYLVFEFWGRIKY